MATIFEIFEMTRFFCWKSQRLTNFYLARMTKRKLTGESNYVRKLVSKRDCELWKSMEKVVKMRPCESSWAQLMVNQIKKLLRKRDCESWIRESPWKKARKRHGEYDYETCKQTQFWIWRFTEKVVKMPRRNSLLRQRCS